MRRLTGWLMIFVAGLSVAAWGQSPTVPVNPWQVQGVVVTLSDTAGFARDAALEQAARQALPLVLQGPLGIQPAEAARKAKTVGDAMRFVSRYQIMNERVLPVYSLTADLTFREDLLRKNFGGLAGVSATTSLSATAVASASTATAPMPLAASDWVVRIAETTAAGQDRARLALLALPNTTVTYRLISAQGVEFAVRTGQTPDALRRALAGWNPDVQPLQVDAVPAPAVAAPAASPAQGSTPTRRPSWLPDLW